MFIELTTQSDNHPVLVNTDSVAIIENPIHAECLLGFTLQTGTVILFAAEYHLIVKESYNEVLSLMGNG